MEMLNDHRQGSAVQTMRSNGVAPVPAILSVNARITRTEAHVAGPRPTANPFSSSPQVACVPDRSLPRNRPHVTFVPKWATNPPPNV
jgi:hypothetical protein